MFPYMNLLKSENAQFCMDFLEGEEVVTWHTDLGLLKTTKGHFLSF